MSYICPKCKSTQVRRLPAKAVAGMAVGTFIGGMIPKIGSDFGKAIGTTIGTIASMKSNSKYVLLCQECKKSWPEPEKRNIDSNQ